MMCSLDDSQVAVACRSGKSIAEALETLRRRVLVVAL